MDKKVLLLLIGIVALNIFFNGQFQLHYDEAYYWVWAHNLSWSYFDHPPMIAYMIRLTSWFGHQELFVRLSAIITTTITILAIYGLAKRMFGVKVANIAVLLAIACPLIEGVFFVMTIDSPLLMFWSLTLYTFYIGVFENRAKFIYFSGVLAGCGLLSKYTAAIIFPGLFLFLLTSREYRYFLVKKEIYLAFILAMLVFSPVIFWNYQHHWVSFAYQFNHGVNTSLEINQQSFGDYWGGSALVAGPILFVAMLYYSFRYLVRNLINPKLAFLFWSYVFGLIFFAYFSLFKHTEANWTAPIYISAIILLAMWLVRTNNRFVYRTSLGLIFIVIIAAKLPLLFTPSIYHNKVPGLNVFYGNKELLNRVKPYLTKNTVLLACDYGNASRAWYYLQLDRVYVLKQFSFANAYRYWDSSGINMTNTPIMHAVYICDSEDREADAVLHRYFKSVRLLEYATFSNVITDNKLYIYQVSN
ncbi:MAG: hypothetical protein QG673_967 [Pseudomonadota bacterium]|nr:hypothetical protein [Pseudomonadota bacterium]